MTSCKLLVQTDDILGECPVLNDAQDAILWADIERRLLHRMNLRTRALDQWQLPEKIGSFEFQHDRLVVALESGLYQFDCEAQNLMLLAAPERGQGTRFNDGKCDPQGRFWAGTMHSTGAEHIGSLYCLDAGGQCRRVLSDLGIPNGLAWSPDGTTMYLADSMDRTIYAFDFDADQGTLRNRRVFADTSSLSGLPDGAAVDPEGFLWSAQCNGWSLVRYAPTGSVDRVVRLPVQYPTSCVFGCDGRTLYVTTAIWDIQLEDRAKSQPWAGGLLQLSGLF